MKRQGQTAWSSSKGKIWEAKQDSWTLAHRVTEQSLPRAMSALKTNFGIGTSNMVTGLMAYKLF